MPIELSELRKWKRVSLKDYPDISFEARELTHLQTRALTSTQRTLIDEKGDFVHATKSDELELLMEANTRAWEGIVLDGQEVTDIAQIWEHGPNLLVGGIIGAMLRASTLSGDEMGNSAPPSATPPEG
jgi:hypothetical protein